MSAAQEVANKVLQLADIPRNNVAASEPQLSLSRAAAKQSVGTENVKSFVKVKFNL